MTGGVGVGVEHLLLSGESQGRNMMLRKENVKGRVTVVGGTITLDATSRRIEGGVDVVGISSTFILELPKIIRFAIYMVFVA